MDIYECSKKCYKCNKCETLEKMEVLDCASHWNKLANLPYDTKYSCQVSDLILLI